MKLLKFENITTYILTASILGAGFFLYQKEQTPSILASLQNRFSSSIEVSSSAISIEGVRIIEEENPTSIISSESISSKINSAITSQSSTILNPVTIKPEPFKASEQPVTPVLLEIPTDKPVIFLGMDDGVVLSEDAKNFLIGKKWPITLFINKKHYDKNIDYFKSILAAGAVLGDHTANHPNLNKYTYEQQKVEICGSQDAYEKDFGIKPVLFRPPYGNYNNNTKQAVRECGLKAIVNWKARIEDGKIYYQQGDRLLKGQIVLMHFVPSVVEDLRSFEAEITKQGLEVGNLNDWIQ